VNQRRRMLVILWRLMNPAVRLVAGIMPWWVLLETAGHRTGRQRRTPLAAGPYDGDAMWLIAVHGRRAAWVRNIEASAHVRIKHRGRWRDGIAAIQPFDRPTVGRFNAYARAGPQPSASTRSWSPFDSNHGRIDTDSGRQ